MSGPEYCIGLHRDILIENPSSWVAQWSEYKHHNTFRLLVGVTPNGTVTYVSGPEYCIGLHRDILIENPSSWVAQWSEYKHHNTFKLLVGVTPNGTVTCLGRSTVLDWTEIY